MSFSLGLKHRRVLFDIRHDLVRKLNDAAGAKVINDIRLLG